jgi:hypothetical protein
VHSTQTNSFPPCKGVCAAVLLTTPCAHTPRWCHRPTQHRSCLLRKACFMCCTAQHPLHMLSNNGPNMPSSNKAALAANFGGYAPSASPYHFHAGPHTCAWGTPQRMGHVLRKGAVHNRCAGLHRQLVASCRANSHALVSLPQQRAASHCDTIHTITGAQTTRVACVVTVSTHAGVLGPVLQ